MKTLNFDSDLPTTHLDSFSISKIRNVGRYVNPILSSLEILHFRREWYNRLNLIVHNNGYYQIGASI